MVRVMIKAVIFDLDGTLVDSMGIWEKIDVHFLTKRGLVAPDGYIDTIGSYTLVESAEYTIKLFGIPDTVDEIIDEWNEMARYEYTHNVIIKPNAKEFIISLKASGIKVCIATGSPTELYTLALEKNGIYDLFDFMCSTDDVGIGKDSPDIYEYVAKKIGVSASECVVFEDIPQAIKSAKQIGMYAYGVYDEFSKQHEEEIKRIADGYIVDWGHENLLSKIINL